MKTPFLSLPRNEAADQPVDHLDSLQILAAAKGYTIAEAVLGQTP